MSTRKTSCAKIIASTLAYVVVFLAPLHARAAEPKKTSLLDQFRSGFTTTAYVAYQGPATPLESQIILYVNFLLAFIGVVFLILMLYAGWTWLMARGAEEQIDKAKRVIRHSIIGFLAILLARIFTEFVIIQIYAALGGT